MAFLGHLFANTFPAVELLFSREIILAGVVHALQNHRVPAWQGSEGTSVGHPAQPLPKQGHPEQAAQDCVQAGLEYLE